MTGSWCDCDSGLSRCARRRSRRQHWPKAAKRWSETKRRRWLEQRDGKAGRVRGDVVAWRGYVVRLARLASGPVGLLVHWYRGGIEDEAFTIDIRAPARLSTVTPGDFAAFDEDVLYQFVSGWRLEVRDALNAGVATERRRRPENHFEHDKEGRDEGEVPPHQGAIAATIRAGIRGIWSVRPGAGVTPNATGSPLYPTRPAPFSNRMTKRRRKSRGWTTKS